MIELGTLGTTYLRAGGTEIDSVLAQTKRMALLVYLAIARPRGFHRRSALLALFWPEQDERHARWSLNQSLRYLRETLGANIVRSRGTDEIALDGEMMWCDAVAFETACAEKHWEVALKLYQGELLHAFHIPGCAEFEQWLESERAHFCRLACRAAWGVADNRETDGDFVAAADVAQRAIALSPDDERGIRRLIDLLDRAGDRAGAVRAYEEYARRLRAMFDVEPAPETGAAIARIRARVEATTSAPTPAAISSPTPTVARMPERQVIAHRASVEPSRIVAVRAVRAFLPRRLLLRSAAVLAIAVVVWLVSRTPTPDSSAPRSIAVLPCTSRVQDNQKRYLGDIITQDIIAELAKRRLFEKVIAAASSERYRGGIKSPEKIRAELGVEALLYCEYEQAGSEERVRVKVVDGRNSSPQWTREFRRDLTLTSTAMLPVAVVDALSRTAGIARRVPSVETASERVPDLSALNLYKQGQYYLNRFTEPDVRRSIYLFNESLAHDSTFALPYVGLARAYYLLGIAFGSMEPLDAFPLMKQSAERALVLDDRLAEAHALLGEYEIAFGWHWATAETHLRLAIELDPYDPQALQSLAYYLTIVGRYDEVRELSSRAIDLSPVDPMVWNNAGRNYFLAGRFDDAVLFLQKGLELAPDFPPLLLEAGHLATERGDARRAVEYLRRADSLSGHQIIIRGRLAYAYALAGDSVASRAVLRQLKHVAVGSRPPAKTATAIAVAYIGLGERDSAFTWLNIAYKQRSGNLVHVLRSPSGWRRLVSDPRYYALLDRIGLTPTAVAPMVVAAEHGR